MIVSRKAVFSFDVPIKDAAEKIAGSQENFAKFMERTVGDLQREFEKQNENNRQQLDASVQLNQRIETLLTQLDQNSKAQGTEVHAFSQNVGGLKEDITALRSHIDSLTSHSGALNQSVRAIEGHVQVLGESAKKFAETSNIAPLIADTNSLHQSVNSLNQSIRLIVQYVQTLRVPASRSAESVIPQSAPRLPEIQKREKFLGIFWRNRHNQR